MKRSLRHSGALTAAAVAALDLVARLMVPASVVALARGYTALAATLATAVNALAVARGAASGWLLEGKTRQAYLELVAASAAYDVVVLRSRGPQHSVTMLMGAAHRVASAAAMTVPRLLGNGVGLLLVGGIVVWTAPLRWVALGAFALAVVGGLVFLLQRSQRRREQEHYDRVSDIVVQLEALLDGCIELRAHDQQERLTEMLSMSAEASARARGRSASLSALLGLLPFGVVLLVATPLASRLRQAVGSDSVIELAALGATVLALVLGLARATGDWVRSSPERLAFREYVEGAPSPLESSIDEHPERWLRDAPIHFDDVSVTYAGCGLETPCRMQHVWAPEHGLALNGDNGAGKSTLALVLLGLVVPTAGIVSIGVDANQGAAIRKRVAYLAQNPFTAPAQSIRWHLQLLAGDGFSDSDAERALDELGLEHLRARRPQGSPLDLLCGDLSGGERRRMHLARLLLPHGGARPELVVLDEPEASLDPVGRRDLLRFLQRLARSSRVLVVAHDPSVVPENFEQFTVRRSHASVAAA